MVSSSPAQNTDLARWTRKKAWTVEQAALLLSGIDPDCFEPDEGVYATPPIGVRQNAIYPEMTFKWFLLIEDGLVRKELVLLKNTLAPTTWVQWAKERCSHDVPTYLAGTATNTAQQMPQRQRKGPKPGTVKRFEESDRSLFPEIVRLIHAGTPMTAACRKIADENKLAGPATNESKADRLRKLFSLHRQRDPFRS